MSTPAGSAARDQVSRLLLLVPLLHGRDSVRVEEAAALVGTTPAQVVADLKVLFMCGLPGGYPGDLIDVDLDALEGEEGDGVIRVSNADYLARPMRLTSTEASAVIVALRALRATADEETRDVVDRALAKLKEVAARGAAGRIEPGVDDQEADEARLRADLEDAVRTGRQVRLVYYVPTRDEESVRVVDPRAVRTEHGRTYLDGWCHLAEAPRLFRLDRVREHAVLDTPVTTDQDSLDALSATFLEPSDDTMRVTLRLQQGAHWVTDYYPVEAVRSRRGGVLEVDLLVADERWLQRLLLRLAPDAEVVAPTEVQDRFTRQARRIVGLYRDNA